MEHETRKYAEIWHDFYFFNCPHCDIKIIVHNSEINCCIFRCSPILGPHASKYECNAQFKQDPLSGCCKPFKILPDFEIIKCDYE